MAARKPSARRAASRRPRKAGPRKTGPRSKPAAKPVRKACRRGRTAAKARRRILWRVGKWAAITVLWLVVVGAGFVGYYAHDLPDTDALTGPETPLSVTVFAADGSTIANVGEMWGAFVPVAEMPPALPEAVLAIEDRRFFEHGGIDVFGVIRAAWRNAVSGRVVAGGSTISQQVAKLVFLSPERSVKRKIQEAMLAFWLEREFTKEEILTIYLNRAYFGAGAYGVDAAARRYFGRGARRVTVAQAALIAGLLKAPSRYSPAGNPALARRRAGVVVEAMAEAGFLSRSEAGAAAAAVKNLAIVPPAGPAAGYFADWIAAQVPGYVGREHGVLRVHTTLDPARQRAAEAAVSEALAASGRARRIGQGALVALDGTGAVRAMVGGRDYRKSRFNRATQARRQPGSAFKTLVYLAAVEDGLAPDDVLEDAPVSIAGWAPRNHDGRYRGPMTVREAFARSVNTVAVRAGLRAGVARIREAAFAAGHRERASRRREPRPRHGRGDAARAHGGLCGAGRRRQASPSARNRRDPRPRGSASLPPGGVGRRPRGGPAGGGRHARPARRRRRRGHRPRRRPAAGARTGLWQDRHHAEVPRRLVRRLGRRPDGGRLARQRRRRPDGRGDGRQPPGRHLARFHDPRAPVTGSRAVDKVDERAGDGAAGEAGGAQGCAVRVVDFEQRAAFAF